MNEFRAKLTLYFEAEGIGHARIIIEAILLAHEHSKTAHNTYESTGSIEFNHPTMGWVNIDDNDLDEDGEAYLAQSG